MWIRVYGCDIQDSPFQVSFLVQDQSFDILSLLQVTCLPDEEVRRGVRSYSGSLPRPRTSAGRQVRRADTSHVTHPAPSSNTGQEEHTRGQTSQCKVNFQHIYHPMSKEKIHIHLFMSSVLTNCRSWTSLGSSRNTMDDDLILAVGSRGRGKGEFTNPQVLMVMVTMTR